MPLKLITGPANSGKAGAVLDEYRARLAEDPYLVVPTFEDVEHYQRELAASGAVFGGNVVRFSWLMRAIAKRVGYSRPVLGPVQRDLAVGHAVRTAGLKLLAESATTEGFADAARRFIGELETSMVEPQRLYQALRAWAMDSEGRRAYSDEVASIYSRYRSVLDELGSVDEDLFAGRSLEALQKAPEKWGRSPVFFYGFDDFTPLQIAVIHTLAKPAEADVTVSLAYDEGHVAFRDRMKTVQALEPLAESREHLAPSAAHYAAVSREPLHHLERNVFQNDPQRVNPAGAVRLFRSGGERAEAELVAAETLRLLRSGVAPDDIAIVYRSPNQYASLMEQVLGTYGVPYSLNWSVPLSHTSLGRGFLALFDAAIAGGSADDLLTYLRTPGRVREPHLIDALEAQIRREGVETAARAHDLWDKGQNRWRLEEFDRLTVAEAQGTTTFLTQLGAELERMFTGPYRRRAHVLADQELDDAKVFRSAHGALVELGDIIAGEPHVSFTVGDVRRALSDLPVRIGAGPRTGRVRVTHPQAIRARRFRTIFVCGLQEAEFPRLGRPDPFLPDRERHEIAASSGLVLRDHEGTIDAERYLFYACVSRPEEQLVLSSRSSDEEGNPRVTSFFVEDVRDLFSDKLSDEARTRGLGEVTWKLSEAPTERELARARAARGRRSRLKPLPSLSDDVVLAELQARHRFSAGEIECFAECSVKWLVERVLRADALEPPPLAMASGGFVHAVLEKTLTRLREETGSGRVTRKTLERAEAILVEVIKEEQIEHLITPDSTRARVELRKVEFDLLKFLGHEAGDDGALEPEYLELRFGTPAAKHPVLELGDGISFSGIIDRIDTAAGKALVRDYKGKTAYPVSKWEPDRRLQVAIYMLAVKELLGLDPIGGVYQAVRKPDDLRPRGMLLDTAEARGLLGDDYVGKDWRTAEEFEQELNIARERVMDVIAELRGGKLEPCPETCAWSGGCAYPTICRSEGT